jgi:hypothetical protein
LYPFRLKKNVFRLPKEKEFKLRREKEAVNKTSLGSRQRTAQGRFRVLSSYVMAEEE